MQVPSAPADWPRDHGAYLIGAAGAALCGAAFAISAYLAHPLSLPLAAVGVAFVMVTVARPAWGVAGALLLTPLELVEITLVGGAVSPAEAGLALVALGWLYRALLLPGSVPLPSARDLPVLAFLGAVAAGLAVARDPAPVLRVLVLWTLFYFVYLQVQAFSVEEIRNVLGAFLLGAGVLGAVGAFRYAGSGQTGLLAGGELTRARAVGTFADANYYASLLVLALLPGIALLLSDLRRHLWLLPGAAGALAGLLFSLSRGGMLGFAAGLGCLLSWRRARWAIVGVVAVVALLASAKVNPLPGSDLLTVVEQRLATLERPFSTGSSRLELWRNATRVASEHPVVGVGVHQFQAATGLVERGSPLENAHSIPLSLAAETGFAGLLAFVAFFGQLVARGLRAVRLAHGLQYALALGLLSALVAFAIQGLTVVQIRTPIVMGAFFVVAGMLTRLSDLAAANDGGARVATVGQPEQRRRALSARL